MNALLLQEKLINQPDKIESILESIGISDITFNPTKNQIRFARDELRNPSSVMFDCNTLRYYVFSTNDSGNIFSLIMSKRNCSFPEALRFAAVKSGINPSSLQIDYRPPFHGFYKKLIPDVEERSTLSVLDEDTLDRFSKCTNIRFLRDGISLNVQEEFGIGYDYETERITIPERAASGELVGVMGRSNDDNCEHEKRWLPIIACPRSKTLFGFSQNFKTISQSREVYIFESEKAVMQCNSFGVYNALATCGCHISDQQVKLIRMLFPKRVIIAYDEGLEYESVLNEAEKLISKMPFLRNIKVGIIWDEASVIPEGSKMNCADLGIEAFEECKKYIKWVN